MPRSATHKVDSSQFSIELLLELQQPPEPFTPGAPLFWDDPHISAQMLAAHLDPHLAAASRTHAEIDRSVAWLAEQLALRPGATVLDLGCGPGLYAARLAARGMRVTGIDYSRRSIDYAVQEAHAQELDIDYRYQNYLTLDETERYDAALLIYGDFCTLAPALRARLLHTIRAALRPHGTLVLDVSTPVHRARHGLRQGWYAAESGFWRAGPHLVMEQGFAYPEAAIFLDQYIVAEAGGALSVYRNWFQDYSAERISAELETHGFVVRSLWSDLAGTPFSADSEWIGVVAQPAASQPQ